LVAKCLFWLVIASLLVVLFLFARRRFQQVVLICGISIVSGVVLRLFSLNSTDARELLDEAYFLIGIGIFYGLIWLVTRYLEQHPRSPTRREQ
jgi:hypothetical protein